MKITINDQEQELDTACTLLSLSQQLHLPEQGTAMAVNNHMIPRPQWENHQLCENDRVIIIKAACGG